MAFPRTQKFKPVPSSPIIYLSICIAAIALLFLFSPLISTSGFYLSSPKILESMPEDKYKNQNHQSGHEKYLYWADKIDCPGKHCESCAGMGHQESSLRRALEEAITFVMPSRMCLNPMHNKKAVLHHSNDGISEENIQSEGASFHLLEGQQTLVPWTLCMIWISSGTIPVILDNSKKWYQVVETSMKLEARGAAHVEGISRVELKENSRFSNLLIINRTPYRFMECKDRKNHSAIILPHSFLPSMVATKLRSAVDKIKELLGDYDAIHVRCGDILKTRMDRFGVSMTLHPHTHPEFILRRIEKWVPSGRTLYIAQMRGHGDFFHLFQSGKSFSGMFRFCSPSTLEMKTCLYMMGAKTFINTFKEDDSDLNLTNDQKNTKVWQIPVYTMDEEGT
ncbi:unnamed protein product [Malus baccata var. baccata]